MPDGSEGLELQIRVRCSVSIGLLNGARLTAPGAFSSYGSRLLRLLTRRAFVFDDFPQFRELFLLGQSAQVCGARHCDLAGFDCLNKLGGTVSQNNLGTGNIPLADFEDFSGPADRQTPRLRSLISNRPAAWPRALRRICAGSWTGAGGERSD